MIRQGNIGRGRVSSTPPPSQWQWLWLAAGARWHRSGPDLCDVYGVLPCAPLRLPVLHQRLERGPLDRNATTIAAAGDGGGGRSCRRLISGHPQALQSAR